MIVTCVQLDVAWHDQAANFAAARGLIVESGLVSDLLVLPEMFSTGFTMDLAAAAEDQCQPACSELVEGRSPELVEGAEAFLAETAARHRCLTLGGVVRLAPDGLVEPPAVLFGPDRRELLRYTKMHPFTLAGEADHYTPGDEPRVADLTLMDHELTEESHDPAVKLSAFVCYDLRFPEVFRAAALAGAEVLAVIANWPAIRADHWRALLIARAIENQAYVVGVNRVGSDPNQRYAGGSMVVDPRGRIVAQAGDGEEAVSAELDIHALRQYRREFPALADARREWIRQPK